MRIYAHKITTICLAALIMFIITVPARTTSASPNVMLICVDDLRTALGCYGDKIARTPNIDRLASEGTKFTRAYCQYPLCNPSRTSFLSGKRPTTTRVVDNETDPKKFLKGAKFLPEYFEAQGYLTAEVGKVEHHTMENSAQDESLPEWEASPLADEQLHDGLTTIHAIEWLEQNADRTFFISVGFRKPHRPLIAPKKYFELYNLDNIPLPDDALVDDGFTLKQKREVILAYYACVSFIDAQIGLLLDELERLGLRQNTLVVLVSDHGVDLGERNRFLKKESLHENVLKVPMILSGPKVPGGLSLSHLVEMVDLYPTMAELCGLPPPSGMEGLSFVPVIENPAISWKTATFSDNDTLEKPSRSIRTDQYRYISFADGQESLFDLNLNPDETVDLAQSSKNRKLVKQMRKLLRKGWKAALP